LEEIALFKLEMSDAIKKLYPALAWDLRFIHQDACALDPDIPEDRFLVYVRKSRRDDYWNGHAYPYKATKRYGKRVEHLNGRITMSLGGDIDHADIVRIFSHELRHLGQYARGRKALGFLTNANMPISEREPDCLRFEGRVLKAMMVEDDLHYRNEGRPRPRASEREVYAA
jgi:hypothetical protein